MTARNEHTGDALTTGPASDAYRAGHEGIDWSVKRETVPACFLTSFGPSDYQCWVPECKHAAACKREQGKQELKP